MGDNTLRALASDLAYLGSWCLMATEGPLPWPAPEALLLKFVAHHLWDPARRETDPKHGMPAAVEQALRTGGFLRTSGPHAPATVGRRLANWSTLTKWRGLDGAFGSPALKSAIRLAIRAAPRQRLRKRRLGEIAGDLRRRQSARSPRSGDPDGRLRVRRPPAQRSRWPAQGAADDRAARCRRGPLPSLSIHLGRTKNSGASQDEVVYLTGRPVEALNAWLAAAKIDSGSVFRGIDRWGHVSGRALDPKAINDIVKRRVAMAGLEVGEFSAHGLRSGYRGGKPWHPPAGGD